MYTVRLHFAEPDDYGPQWSGRWATDQLPMIPEHWKLKTERSTAKQFQVVKRLINDPGTEQVVCATDAGREGENIFRLIYAHARCRKPFQRLWVSSLTDEAIREGFRQLRPGSAFNDLRHRTLLSNGQNTFNLQYINYLTYN